MIHLKSAPAPSTEFQVTLEVEAVILLSYSIIVRNGCSIFLMLSRQFAHFLKAILAISNTQSLPQSKWQSKIRKGKSNQTTKVYAYKNNVMGVYQYVDSRKKG